MDLIVLLPHDSVLPTLLLHLLRILPIRLPIHQTLQLLLILNLHLRNPEVADSVTTMAETALWPIGLENHHSLDRRHRYLTTSPMKEG